MCLKKRKRIGILCIFFIICFFLPLNVEAKNEARIEKGTLIFVTTDTKATSGITWKTVGFTITRQKCLSGSAKNGGYPTKLKHATLWLDSNGKVEELNQDGKTYTVTFTVKEEVVTKALSKAGMDDIQDNDILYLHGIFQVMHGGKNFGGKKDNLPDIKKAEMWKNPNDFKDHFDIEVKYEASENKAPIYLEYRTETGQVIRSDILPKEQWTEPKQTAKIVLEEKIEYNNKTYTIKQSYYSYMNNLSKKMESFTVKSDGMEKVRKRTAPQKLKGIKFVAVMSAKQGVEKEEEMSKDLTEAIVFGEIRADLLGNEKFDVEQGIPSSESVYGIVRAKNLLTQYKFKKRMGKKLYPVNIKKTYYLYWYDGEERLKEDVQTVTQTCMVEREYSYWEIEEFHAYSLQSATIKNDIFPSGVMQIPAYQAFEPEIELWHSEKESEHIIDPKYEKTIYLSQSINSSFAPAENFQQLAENSVKEIFVKNDRLIMDGVCIMDNQEVKKHTIRPEKIEDDDWNRWNRICEDSVFNFSNYVIPSKTENNIYPSLVGVTYKKIKSINANLEPTYTYESDDINEVLVHTPVVCDAQIQNNKRFNQMLEPDENKASLILDMNFSIQFSLEGYHRDIKGYGYQDYGKYIAKKQVQFPFDVYRNEVLIPKNTWVDMKETTQEYYLPIWVEEGQYAIKYRTIAINAKEKALQEQELANLQMEYDTAIDYTEVEVSGRIYGFQIYDISDYPLWQEVFRKKDSTTLTNIRYRVGTKTENGNERFNHKVYTFPFVNGSHPNYNSQGILKPGYVMRYRITTIGNMYRNQDYIKIKPRFYYIDKNGKNRKEVDIYYSETFQNKRYRLVKIGSDLDKANKKMLTTGDIWLSIPAEELTTTAQIQKKPVSVWKAEKHNMYTFHNIMLSEFVRTYVGKKENLSHISSERAIQAKQYWYGEYYLPADIHIVPKDYNIKEYAKNNSITYKEDFWLKNGYIILNFDIETIQGGKRHLSYINSKKEAQGYCNMWRMEGFSYQKLNEGTIPFYFEHGDLALYSIDKNVSKDYESKGTH